MAGIGDMEFKVTADLNQAVKDTAKLDKALLDLSKDFSVAGAQIAKITAPLNSAQTALAKTAIEANKLDSSLKKGSVGTNQAGNALQNLGRIAQDAPFGFIGIQNNLNPLLESFQRLKAETGSSGAALKALASSLAGPAGVGIALSVVSSLFLVYGKEIKDFFNNTSNATKAQRELNKSLLASEAGVQGQITQYKILVEIAQDVNRSDKSRQEAIDKLNKEYDSFNNKLSLSNVNTKESIKLIDKQSQSFIRQARIKGLESLITKEAEKQAEIMAGSFEDNLSFIDIAKAAIVGGVSQTVGATGLLKDAIKGTGKELAKSSEKINIYTDALKQLLGESADAGDLFIDPKDKKKREKHLLTIAEVLKELNLELTSLNTTELNLKTDETEGKIKATEKAIDDLIKKVGLNPSNPLVLKLFADIGDLQLPLLQKKITDSARKERLALPLVPEFVSQQKLIDSIEEQINGGKGQNKLSVVVPFALKLEDTQAVSGLGSGLQNQIDNMVSKLKDLGITKSLQDGINVAVSALRFPQLTELYNSTITASAAFAEQASGIISSTIASAFSGMGDAIGQALVGADNPIGNFFAGIGKLLGQSLKDLGKYVIASSTLIASLKKSLNAAFAGNPALGIAAGIALIAIGSALENSIPKFAGGVQNFGGGLAMVGERGPEMVRLPIGSDVIPNGQVNAMGGQQIYIPAVTIRGSDLVLAFNRASATINRNG